MKRSHYRLLALPLAAALLPCGHIASAAAQAPAQEEARTAPQPVPLPTIAERYARADAMLGGRLADLVDNADIAPRFVTGGLLYRTGHRSAQTYRFLDLATQDDRVIATSQQLIAALSEATGTAQTTDSAGIGDMDYDAANQQLRFRAAGARWRFSDRSGLKRLEEAAQDGLLSPDGSVRIIARAYNLFAQDVVSRREVALTRDGTREQPYGRSIPELSDILRSGSEDPPMPVSASWSDDGRYLLSWRLDTRGVTPLSITQQNPPGEFYPRSFRYIYPLAGADVLPQATHFVVDVRKALRKRKAQIVPLAVPAESLLFPAPPYSSWVHGKPRIVWTERGYRQQIVYEADPDTGKTRIIAHEAVQPQITVTSSAIQPAPELGGELSISERSGWAQLYLVTPDAPAAGRALTQGAWEVLSVDHVAPDGASLIVTGVGREAVRNPYWRALYKIATADGSLAELTPEPLDHETMVSGDGAWIVDQMSSPQTPNRAVLREGATGRIVRELARGDDSRLRAAGYSAPELFQGFAADGRTPIWGLILRPADFDPARSYPVIDNVYTGPTTTQVPATWAEARSVVGNSVAQLGAIVVMIDGTGTSRRGQAFRLPAYRNLGEVGLDDHIAMIRQMAATYPYMDTTRIGVFGGSAGGYDAARFVLRRPDIFKVGVASSGNHDLRLDKTWWPEVSMGHADAATWQRNSNMAVAGQLKGHLMLIHGDIDDNVPVTESFRLAAALIDAGRDVDLVILPNTTHRVYQPFFWKKLRDYFTQHLLGEIPPPLSPPAPSAAQGAPQ